MRPMRPRPIRSAPSSTRTAHRIRRRCRRTAAINPRARAEQGDRNRHQMGAVRPPPAGDRRAVPDREGQCARNRQRRMLTSGAAYQVQGIDLGVERQDHRPMERVRRPGADAVQGHAAVGIAFDNIGLQLANIAHQSFSMLSKYKFDGVWELGGAGGLPLEDVSAARSSPPTPAPSPELLALRCLRREEDRQELDA